MSPPKKLDRNPHMLVSQKSTGAVPVAGKGGFSALQHERTVPKLTFAEDFLLEHSVSVMHIAKIEIPNHHVLASNERSESCQQFGFPS